MVVDLNCPTTFLIKKKKRVILSLVQRGIVFWLWMKILIYIHVFMLLIMRNMSLEICYMKV